MDKISFLTKAIAEKYTDISVEGAGAIKGKNCQIQSIEEIEGGHRITFAWYNESEVLVTDTLDVMDGEDGADGAKGDTGNGIVKIEKTATSGLTDTYTIIFTDGTTFDYDVVNGADGAVLSVNGKTGNVTLSTNDLVNDSGFIQNTVNNLVNYYLKSQIYTKTEVEDIVSAISTLSLNPVEQLPTTDISTTTIYLIPSSTQGVMDQYINLDGTTAGWVKIGDTSIDLTNYVTTSDLTLALADYVTEAELSTYVVDANYVHTDNNYTDTDKAIVGGVTSALAGKADKSEIPEKTSELTNDSGFITNLVNDLANYYKKTETYTQTEVDALISAIVTLDIKVVATLPTTDISRTTIYLVPSADPQTTNIKDEYINIDGTSAGWELIGSTAVDLSDYVTDTDLATALADYTTTANLTTLLAAKQDTISDLATIRSGASAGASAYQKPATGIPKTDLASAVQTSLEKADTAVQDISDKADKVSNATNGNFAGLDSNGNLTDSGKKASDFMASDGVEANPTGTSTGTLTSIGINGDKYEIQGGGASALANLTDVSITNPSDGQILQYNATSQKWVNEVVGTIPVGAIAIPTDDIQTWLHCAAIWNKNYTLLSEVLADSTTLLALISMPNAVDYMVRSTTWASAVTADSTAMSLIGANDYCADALLDDSTWLDAICNSTYFESVLNVKVPTMTGYTTPYGQAFATTENSARKAWQAFMGRDAEGWASADYQTTNQGIGYKFTQPVNVKYFLLQNPKDTMQAAPYTFNLEYSDDGTNWTKVGETYTNPKIENTDYGYKNYYVSSANNTKHLYWRIYVLTVRNNPTAAIVFTGMIQFYGRA